MNVLHEAVDPDTSDLDLRRESRSLASRRAFRLAGLSEGPLSQPRRRAVLAAFGDRLRLEGALLALPRLGFDLAGFGVLGTPAAFEVLFAGRFQAAPTGGQEPVLVLGDCFADPGGPPAVTKALSRLPAKSEATAFLVSGGWPLPLAAEPGDACASRDWFRLLAPAQGRPAILLGLRLLDGQSAAFVCRTLLAINDGPVELLDLKVS